MHKPHHLVDHGFFFALCVTNHSQNSLFFFWLTNINLARRRGGLCDHHFAFDLAAREH